MGTMMLTDILGLAALIVKITENITTYGGEL